MARYAKPLAVVYSDGAYAGDHEVVRAILELLGLHSNDDAQTVIDQIRDALAVGDAQPWVNALLTSPNWRLHLVAVVAFLLDQPKTIDCAPLWSAIDEGSWG